MAKARGARWSLAGRLAGLAFALVLAAVALAVGLQAWLASPPVAFALTLIVMLPVVAIAVRQFLQPMLSLFRALGGTVDSYRDGDFSFGLAWRRNDEIAELVDTHNALGDALREQRLALIQRELLLDTMVQNTPVAMVLVDPAGRVTYANLAARREFNRGRRLEGHALDGLLAQAPAPLRDAIESGRDGLFGMGEDDDEQTWHVSHREFRLNGRPQRLLMLRQLTTELRRQEVQTWKKVIRVISHELNNSLAPVASLAHSGAELTRRGQHARLESVFATIEERARHLEGFIRGYASFAKLPSPRLEAVMWPALVERLRSQVGFTLEGELPEEPARLDVPQIEQALLNLLKNAHESGSPPEGVTLRVRRLPGQLRIEIGDRGTGMSDAVLANALVPFYSTKRSGTGLGLALAREIAEAHGGRISLGNRKEGGLVVTLVLPTAD
ncbi:ATP-binding protein [Arenimonas sp.]|uniref:sensor histidine kinase n=1 Tax=Arenimonas sp. TaxID=1872635 RepID=UPI0025BDF3E1|nr:ATP-binding protein [Arenimonas sp.]